MSLVDTIYEEAKTLYRSDNYSLAISKFNTVLMLMPDHQYAHRYIAACYERLGQKTDSKIDELYENGKTLYRAEKYREAKAQFKIVCAMKTDHPYASRYMEACDKRINEQGVTSTSNTEYQNAYAAGHKAGFIEGSQVASSVIAEGAKRAGVDVVTLFGKMGLNLPAPHSPAIQSSNFFSPTTKYNIICHQGSRNLWESGERVENGYRVYCIPKKDQYCEFNFIHQADGSYQITNSWGRMLWESGEKVEGGYQLHCTSDRKTSSFSKWTIQYEGNDVFTFFNSGRKWYESRVSGNGGYRVDSVNTNNDGYTKWIVKPIT